MPLYMMPLLMQLRMQILLRQSTTSFQDHRIQMWVVTCVMLLEPLPALQHMWASSKLQLLPAYWALHLQLLRLLWTTLQPLASLLLL
jgi:hypothetical protein